MSTTLSPGAPLSPGPDLGSKRPERPAALAELAALVRSAAADGRPLLTEGNGTKRHHGPAAPDTARMVSLTAFSSITAYEPGDMVVTVQAGVRLVDLQRALGERGQWLPLDPPYADATIGGILATRSAGPRRHGYGTAKDLLLGMHVMGVDGAVTKSGGRVVKNVTGYDLHKLQVGAFGALGIILEASFKVTPLPAVTGAIVLPSADLGEAHARLLAVASAALRPVALEAVDAGGAAALRAMAPELPEAPALAIIGVEGTRPVFDRHVRELGRAGAVVLEGEATARLWTAFRDVPTRRRADVVVRVGARPHDLPALLGALELPSIGATAVFCQAGAGLARVHVPAPTDPGKAAALAAVFQRWAQLAGARQAYAVVEAAPPGLPSRQALPWGESSPLGRSIKQAWDPKQILNPGRAAL